jgi:enoyl-CoA hydratase/carnithine racemase
MHSEYRWVLAELDANTDVRAIVVTGTPPAFCVGGDSDALAGHAARGEYVTGLSGDEARPGYGVRPELDHDFAFQFGMRVPVIAAVNGACAGIGLAVPMFCDLRFVAGPARLTTAAAKIGLPAEYGLSWILPRLVGLTRANDLLLSGRVFTGAESAEWGLWNGVAEDGDSALSMATGYARMLATTAGPRAVAMTKRQIYDDLLSHDVGASITISKRLMNEAMAGAEYREGVDALRAKRPPRF